MIFPLQIQSVKIKQSVVELFVPEAAFVQQSYKNGLISFPYWSQLWPSALALSEFISDNTDLIQNKNLLELGAGLGLPSLVAAKYAATVICSDKDKDAVETISKSARHNGNKNLKAVVIDWNELPDVANIDVILLSDINYEPVAYKRLKEVIFHFIRNAKTIILATPQRLMAKPFIEMFLTYCKEQEEIKVLHKNENVPISILVLGGQD